MKKLNVGSSCTHLTGWVNMEYDKDYWVKAQKGAVGWGKPIVGYDATKDMPDDFGDVCNLHYEDNTFDIVRSGHVMEHIPCKKIHRAINEQYRVLKPGGWIRVSVPSFDILLERYLDQDKYKDFWDKTRNDPGLWKDSELKKPLETVDEALFGILYLNGEHLNSFTKVTLTKILERAGFVNIQSADKDEEKIPDGTIIDYSLRLKGMKPL